MRPSGTEPKLKCYLEARSPALAAGDLDAARATTRGTLTEIRSEMSAALGLTTTGTYGALISHPSSPDRREMGPFHGGRDAFSGNGTNPVAARQAKPDCWPAYWCKL